MNKHIRLQLLFALWLFMMTQGLHANSSRWVSNNTINARPIAMGGAFQAIEDNWAAIHWNPAAFDYISPEEEMNFSIRLNPAGPIILIHDPQGADHGASAMALCIPGLIFRYHRLCIGIITGEEGLSNLSRLEKKSWMNAKEYEWSRNIDIAIRLRFAPRVSMGVAIQSAYQYPNQDSKQWGYRYGLLIKPKPYLQFGLCYYNFDNRIDDTRLNLERLPDETLNIGVAYQPWSQFLLSADIRNVSDDHRTASLEPHFGTEITPFQQLHLRGGYFYRHDIESSNYSMGFGYQSQPIDFGTGFFSHVQYGVDFTYVLEDLLTQKINWKFLNFHITI